MPISDNEYGTADERAARGAARLDERWPDWYIAIDLEAFAIEAQCGCVIGQLRPVMGVSDFRAGLVKLLGPDALEGDMDEEYGFQHGGYGDVDPLTEAWRRLILARRTALEQ